MLLGTLSARGCERGDVTFLLRMASEGRETYTCGRCGQEKKGHTCPYTSTLKHALWADSGVAGRATCALAGAGGHTTSRAAVMAKLLERLETRLVARGEAVHSKSTQQQPASSGVRTETSSSQEGGQRKGREGQDRDACRSNAAHAPDAG